MYEEQKKTSALQSVSWILHYSDVQKWLCGKKKIKKNTEENTRLSLQKGLDKDGHVAC